MSTTNKLSDFKIFGFLILFSASFLIIGVIVMGIFLKSALPAEAGECDGCEPTGSITIEKVAPGGGEQEFLFITALGDFFLVDGESLVFYDRPAGNYIFSEVPGFGWELLDIVCVGDNDDEI